MGDPKIPLKPATQFACRAAALNEDPDASLRSCAIFGCGRPPQARAGKGLSLTHCRYHVQYRNRHGCFWKGTYSAAELRDYRRAAERYLKAHLDDFWIAAALKAIDATLHGAGPNERVVDTLTMRPVHKARAAFARMRVAGVAPLRLLTIHLAVTGAVKEDPIGSGADGGEYRLTQIGKAAMRTASGYHSYYGPGSQYDRYPRSSGQLLRLIGKTLEADCEHVVEAHLGAILAFKAEQYRARIRIVKLGKIA